MRTLLVGLVIAAAALATVPSASAQDILCPNSGADCLYIDDGQDIPAVCLRTESTGTNCTPSDNIPDYYLDSERGVCEPEQYSSESLPGDELYDRQEQSCLAGADGIGCTYYSVSSYQEPDHYVLGEHYGYSCVVAIAPEDAEGSQQHLVCYEYHYDFGRDYPDYEWEDGETYFVCLG